MANVQKQLADGAKEAVTEELRGTIWAVYPDRYSYSPDMRGGGPCAVVFGPALRNRIRYAPLVDTPALVLEFGELGGEEIREDDWRDWVERYGVLGLHKHPESLMGLDRGGMGETLDAFREEAQRAHWILSLYGAATASDGPDVAAIAAIGREAEPGYPPQLTQTPEMAWEFALDLAGTLVQEKLATETFPQLYLTQQGHRSAWGFRSLLGALYLQAMFLLTTTGKVQYCRGPGCYNVIRFDQPKQPSTLGLKKNDRSGGYRIRKDRRYCSPACKMQAYRRRHKLA